MKLWLPITLFVVVTIVATGVYISVKNSAILPTPITSSPPVNILPPPPIESESVQVNLTLEPKISPISVGDESVLLVKIDGKNQRVIGIETYINYDPGAVEILNLEPGPFLPKPQILAESVDHTNGKITYALGTFEPVTGSGILYQIRFKAKLGSKKIKDLLWFDQENSQAALETADKSKRFTPNEIVIVFNEKPLEILP